MSNSSKSTNASKDKFSVPGLARSIVRPVVRTTDAVVSKGEVFTKGAVNTLKHTVSGTVRLASGFVKDTAKTVTKTVSGSQKRKTKKGRKTSQK